MVGQVFLAHQNRPPKWRIFKYRKWKKNLPKYREIKYR